MPISVNTVLRVGRLGRDPDLRFTPEGLAVTRLTLATDRPVRAGTECETDRHQIVCRRTLGVVAEDYLAKGRLVSVAARRTYRPWDGRDSQRRRMAETVAIDRLPEAERLHVSGAAEAAESDDVAL